MLPGPRRLKRPSDFGTAVRRGSRAATPTVVVHVRRNHLQDPPESTRVGFVVSKKVGNAVTRNRIRRRVYEVVRLEQSTLKSGYDMALMVFSAEVYSLDHPSLVKLVKQLFSQAGLYK